MKSWIRQIFSKKLKKEEIYRLLEGNAPQNAQSAVLYIGNGADRVKTPEQVYDHLGGRHDICVATFFESGGRTDVKDVVFSNPDGSLQGYVLRRKRSEVWEWYGCDEAWHTLSADMPGMKLFQTGDALPGADEETPETYILEARWLAEDGAYAGCGYPMFKNKLMAHAFGGLDGKTYHNTLRAFDNARKQNYRYYEVDISMTMDKRLVLCHGWSKSNCKTTGMEYSEDLEHAAYDRIMAKTVHGNPLMDAKDFYKLMKKYPHYRFEVDFHNKTGEDMRERIRLLLEDFKKDPKVMDRLLIQSYNKDMYEGIGQQYPFKYHQYLVGKNIDRLDEFINYALDHGICALALRMNHAKPALVQKIKNAGLFTLAYTVNSDLDIASRLLKTGVDTLCTDFITPAMLEKPVDSLGRYPFYVYYHAGNPEAESGYPDAVRLKSGCFEYQDKEIWENDGKSPLKKCRYKVEGKQFAGWNLRVNIENTLFWYGKDHLYHCKNDSNRPVEHEVFCDEQQLPVLTVKKGMHLVMEATWK